MKNGLNRNNIHEHLVEKQLNFLERTIPDALLNPNWRNEWYLTKEQEEKFRKYAIPLLKRIFKCNKTKAESTFDWFLLNYGLKIK